MAITKKWEVNTLERNLGDGYVSKVIYRVKGMDGEEEKLRATGEVELERPKTLIPYKDLTESTVLGWIKTKLGTDEVTRVEKWLEDEIALINAPVTGTGKPW
tara:strand:+ start:1117 stop:1422 length:306 start_codon:yes stop_codon:yes gene_type:complete